MRILSIEVGPDVGDGCTVSVAYGPDATDPVPDVGMAPWLTRPMNTYETVDLWVDSSCNGYEDSVGPAGLRYGRRADGTVIGNGDDPCAYNENRLYATVHNYGSATASNVKLHFEVTDPLGVGIWGSDGWTAVGTAPTISSIPPGGQVDVWVPWVPDVPDAMLEDRFVYHSCIRAIIDPVVGEVNTVNQDGDREQENVRYFEIVRHATGYSPASGTIRLRNETNDFRSFMLSSAVDLPETWSLVIGDDTSLIRLYPNETREIPVTIEVPPGTPVGESYRVAVRAYAILPPQTPSPGPDTLNGEPEYVSGLVIQATTVDETTIGLDAWSNYPVMTASGCLSHRVSGQTLTIEYTSPSGVVYPSLAMTDDAGCFWGQFLQQEQGLWQVRALWHGDAIHGRAESLSLKIGNGQALSNCCESSTAPGCTYPDIEPCVCGSDSYCCDIRWDSICVGEVDSLGCGTCHPACTTGVAGCFEQSMETCVCGVDAYCCTTKWDSICVGEVDSTNCGTCGSSAPMSGGSAASTSFSTASTDADRDASVPAPPAAACPAGGR